MEEKKNWYDKYYKLLLLIPIIVLILSFLYLYNFYEKNGDIIYKDVTLTGGTTISVFTDNVDVQAVKDVILKDFPDAKIRGISDFRTGAQRGFILETKEDAEVVKPKLEEALGFKLDQDNSSIEFSGATLSQGFYHQLRVAILSAFIFMAIVVFLIFRTFVPSTAVVLAALTDIVLTVTVVDLLGMSLGTAGIIAFLLIIGYSVDTDILLTNRVLKKKTESINSRIHGAFKTGITMTLTSIAASAVAFIVIHNTSEVLRQIFTILLIGLGFDILSTWFANASIIKWYAEKKEGGK